jgi:hypothetical protein
MLLRYSPIFDNGRPHGAGAVHDDVGATRRLQRWQHQPKPQPPRAEVHVQLVSRKGQPARTIRVKLPGTATAVVVENVGDKKNSKRTSRMPGKRQARTKGVGLLCALTDVMGTEQGHSVAGCAPPKR